MSATCNCQTKLTEPVVVEQGLTSHQTHYRSYRWCGVICTACYFKQSYSSVMTVTISPCTVIAVEF